MNSVVQFLKRLAQILFFLVVVVFLGSLLIGVGGLIAALRSPAENVEKPSILALDLDGIIVDTRDIVESLRKYRTEDRIKGVLLRINSPGGVVGPSQELWAELKRTLEEFKKPVVAFCSAVAASGAYYAAVGADKIVTTPGCLIGSIGALMEFVNLAKLYDWAKIDRYAITTGKFKDAGAEYQPLTSEQRALFQDLLNDVLAQFKAAIVEGRNMKPEVLDQYADGRVFTGSQAVKLGFADSVGTWDDARRNDRSRRQPGSLQSEKAEQAFGVLRTVVNFGDLKRLGRPSRHFSDRVERASFAVVAGSGSVLERRGMWPPPR